MLLILNCKVIRTIVEILRQGKDFSWEGVQYVLHVVNFVNLCDRILKFKITAKGNHIGKLW